MLISDARSHSKEQMSNEVGGMEDSRLIFPQKNVSSLIPFFIWGFRMKD